MSQINSNIKDDFQVVLLMSCFVGHPVSEKNKCTPAKTFRLNEFAEMRGINFNQYIETIYI